MRDFFEMRSGIGRKEFRALRPYLAVLLSLAVFLVYGPFLKRHYALDTYFVEALGNQGELQIDLGRFLSGTILNMLASLGVNTAVDQSFFTFLSLCLLALSLYLVISLLFGLREEWDGKSLLLLCLAAVASLCHIFMLGWFLFPEVVSFMMTGLVLSILAVSFFMRYSGPRRWITSYVLLCAAFSFYQAVGAFFVTFCILYLSVSGAGRPVASVMKGFASAFVVYGLAGITNMFLIVWRGQPSGRTDFLHVHPLRNIYGIIDSVREKLQNTHLGAAPLLAFFFVLAALLLCGWLLLSKSPDKKGARRTFLVLSAVICTSFAAIIMPHLLTSAVDVSPRSIVALMSLPGVICIFMLFQAMPSKRRLFFFVTAGFLLLFFFANTYMTYSVEKSRFATNRLDREIAGTIWQEIIEYERRTGNLVSRIAFRHDTKPSLCYRGLVCYGNFRAMGTDWTVIPLLSIVSGRSFAQASMPERIYDTYFEGRNWDSFSTAQVVFQADTLYLMLF
jgi:hypothetical protein